MASEQVLDIPVRRHVLTSERPFQVVLDSIYTGISQPDIGALFARLAASTSYDEFTALVRQAQGSAGLIRFLQLDDDHVLALDPQADQAGCRLVRLIAGNPVTMGQMTRHLPAAGSYAPVTILIQELPGGQNPGSLRHRRQRDRALRGCRRLPGRPAAGHRSPQPPAPRDRHAGHRNRGTPAPENALAQSQTAVNAQALRAGDHEQIVPTNCRLPAER